MARNRIYLCGLPEEAPPPGGPSNASTARIRAEQDACPNAADHVYGPRGYVQWHEWAERMSKTHRQSKCKGCGYWLIAWPKTAKVAEEGNRG